MLPERRFTLAKIIGLEEQQKALADIRGLLRKVEQINTFLENMDKAEDGFMLSYKVYEEPKPEKTSPEDLSEDFDMSEEDDDYIDSSDNDENLNQSDGREEDHLSLQNPTEVPKGKIKQYKAPFITNDSSFIKECVLKSKEVHVKKIYDSASEYHISLDDEDKAIIERFG